MTGMLRLRLQQQVVPLYEILDRQVDVRICDQRLVMTGIFGWAMSFDGKVHQTDNLRQAIVLVSAAHAGGRGPSVTNSGHCCTVAGDCTAPQGHQTPSPGRVTIMTRQTLGARHVSIRPLGLAFGGQERARPNGRSAGWQCTGDGSPRARWAPRLCFSVIGRS